MNFENLGVNVLVVGDYNLSSVPFFIGIVLNTWFKWMYVWVLKFGFFLIQIDLYVVGWCWFIFRLDLLSDSVLECGTLLLIVWVLLSGRLQVASERCYHVLFPNIPLWRLLKLKIDDVLRTLPRFVFVEFQLSLHHFNYLFAVLELQSDFLCLLNIFFTQ